MSLRKNMLIAVAIIILCMVLVTQLIGHPSPRKPEGNVAVNSGGTDKETTEQEPLETIQLAAVTNLDPETFERLTIWNNRFNEEHSHIQVKLTNLDQRSAYSTLKERAKTGETPDIMLLDHVWVSEFAASGYLSSELRLHMDAFDKDTYLEWNGYPWAVSFTSDPYVLAINEQVFEEYGLVPASATEWLDYASIREDSADEAGVIYSSPDDPYSFVSFVWSMGGLLEPSDEGMYNLGDLTVSKLVVKQRLGEEERWEQFESGKLPAMIIRASEWNRRTEGASYEHWRLQQIDGKEGLWPTGASLAVSSISAHPDESFQWIASMKEMSIQDTAVHPSFAIPSDPELNRKMQLIASAIPALLDGSIPADEWNKTLAHSWSSVRR